MAVWQWVFQGSNCHSMLKESSLTLDFLVPNCRSLPYQGNCRGVLRFLPSTASAVPISLYGALVGGVAELG